MGLARPTQAQDTDPASAWRVASAPHDDLWYHGLAVVEFRGFGPLALYDEFYPAQIRREKAGRAAPESRLDQQAQRFRDAFSSDSTFEFLHFWPLYFAAADRESMLSALRALAENVARPAIPSPAAQFGANAAYRFFAPALGPYLRSARLDGGVIFVSAALGQEGRIFRGDLENRVDNLVAVGLRPAGSLPDAELYAAVRELCFPLVR